jgi:dolichol-phosphate mannosyltransferase
MYSVVVPLHNEEGNICSLVEEIHNTFQTIIKQPYELLLIDDASSDKTCDEIQKLKKQYPEIVPLQHSHQAGQSRAIKTGIEQALYNIIITLDGDGQNNPADIPLLLNAYKKQNEFGLVIGHRIKRKDSQKKVLSSKIAYKVRQFFLKDGVPDSGCGLKVFSKSLFQSMPYFNHMHRYIPAMTKRLGEPISSVPVSHRRREAGRSNYGTLDRFLVGISDILGVVWLLKRYDAKVKIHGL